MTQAEIARMTSTELKQTFEEMVLAIGESLSGLASSDHAEDGEDEHDEETGQCKLRKDDEPSWGMGTIIKTVQPRMEKFWQKRIQLDELTSLGWEDAANFFYQQDKKNGKSEWRVPAVVDPHTDDGALAPPPTTFGELIERFDIVSRIRQLPQGTSRP
jgi:hypothetical protein